jgi:hypothetical protein
MMIAMAVVVVTSCHQCLLHWRGDDGTPRDDTGMLNRFLNQPQKTR